MQFFNWLQSKMKSMSEADALELVEMKKARNRNCKLSHKSPQYFKKLFEENQFEIIKNRELCEDGSIVWDGSYQGMIEVGDEDDEFFFEIYLELLSNIIDPKLIATAENVVDNVIELDDAARSISDDHEYDERLAYISIDQSEIRFAYWATTVNTEWDVVFTIDNFHKFKCLGIPDHQNPGEFII